MVYCLVDNTLNDSQLQTMYWHRLILKKPWCKTIDLHDGYGVGLNCTLGMSITHGIGSTPVDWHVNMITHLFAGRYAWYKRLCF